MDFDFDSNQQALRDSIRRYLKAEVAPRIDACEAERRIPQDLLQGLAQFGYIGGLLPEDAGGFDLDFVTWAMMVEEAGYCWGSLRTIVNITNIFLRLVQGHGTARQRERFLAPVLASEKSVCVAISEPNHGSNVAGIECRADDRGDHYLLNGSKLWITNGVNADCAIVLARTYSDTCQGKPSLFLVERAASPYAARLVDKMVLKASGTSELSFDDVRVPKENLLGAEGVALKTMLAGLNYGRLNIAMGAVGAAQAALDLSVEYAKTRRQFGRPIGEFQLIQKHIVDMMVRTEAARALGYKAAAAMQKGQPARIECSIAKLYAAEAAHEVARIALSVHGGLGYSTEYPLERIFRDTSGGIIPEGTAEVQTLIVGREVLGMSAINAAENKA
ncbi:MULTISPECIES: acyl-CoA dehydrogenase family protein [Bordetella]|uniref:Acyl-CoA dehydrogenase n=1 Tax=Bordetella genomosp. 6 TaxID=463024 RepID=A0ABX4F9A5_9BORD|nr:MULTISPECIES: acyl-CoA dehydrogenase family protein [Bordetella]AWP73988.1 acyl-CoA dehydrogenase [Bordetella bronchiseptica]KCV62525.1 putative acyl-CoA dehydrogenase [Bordetella bronchiseptica 99-R-0433]KDB66622.1 putative acyl-CoA dehydrogenase [Bordetella bronchiseptica A1-7]KDB67947.1 putative acyl-CoA dehydrogenase [Bordetella bronchiseptica B20-10725633]KDC01233.1 putative acyl-CoA dehydrogenase [Bordetella bronchiseptica D993]